MKITCKWAHGSHHDHLYQHRPLLTLPQSTEGRGFPLTRTGRVCTINEEVDSRNR